ncbi:hypothetical protein G6F56_013323 [Rhizopus delemar]|nr:hypothetical protein G6F56_013323 [Rhizopus delemar]
MLKNNHSLIRMPDASVELYLITVFQCTPRKDQVTAPLEEWYELLPIINVRENYYILSPDELGALEPYCSKNPKLEMSPEDFTRLIGMVRSADSEITPEMSVSASMRRHRTEFYDDVESLQHPEPQFSDSMRELNGRDIVNQSPYEPTNNYLRVKKKNTL